MVDTAYLASTLLMGLLGIGVIVLVLRVRRWNHYAPRVAYSDLDAGRGQPDSPFTRFVSSTNTWTVAYVLLVLGFMAGVIVYLSGAITGPAVVYAVGGIVALYLIAGTYIVIREGGRPSAQAIAASIIIIGLLILGAITARLVAA